MNENDVSIKINSKVIHGWTQVSIAKSMQNLSSEFEVVYKLDNELMGFLSGQDPIEINIGNEKVLTGYIFKLKPSFSNDGDTVSIKGRDKASDLVDCSAVNSPGMWKNVNLESIIRDLCFPFDIDVAATVDIGDRFTQWSINTGESVFEAITRACRERAVLPIINEDGNLEITTVSDVISNDALIYGQNVLSGNSDIDYTGRYSEYVVKSQSTKAGSGWSKSSISVYAKAEDLGVERYRPLQLRADDQVNTKNAQKRANWEAQIRAGVGVKSTLPVEGWRQSNGELWKVNRLVHIDILKLNLRTTLLISGINMTYGNNGRQTSMTIVDPSTFAVNPPEKITKKSKTGWTLR